MRPAEALVSVPPDTLRGMSRRLALHAVVRETEASAKLVRLLSERPEVWGRMKDAEYGILPRGEPLTDRENALGAALAGAFGFGGEGGASIALSAGEAALDVLMTITKAEMRSGPPRRGAERLVRQVGVAVEGLRLCLLAERVVLFSKRIATFGDELGEGVWEFSRMLVAHCRGERVTFRTEDLDKAGALAVACGFGFCGGEQVLSLGRAGGFPSDGTTLLQWTAAAGTPGVLSPMSMLETIAGTLASCLGRQDWLVDESATRRWLERTAKSVSKAIDDLGNLIFPKQGDSLPPMSLLPGEGNAKQCRDWATSLRRYIRHTRKKLDIQPSLPSAGTKRPRPLDQNSQKSSKKPTFAQPSSPVAVSILSSSSFSSPERPPKQSELSPSSSPTQEDVETLRESLYVERIANAALHAWMSTRISPDDENTEIAASRRAAAAVALTQSLMARIRELEAASQKVKKTEDEK